MDLLFSHPELSSRHVPVIRELSEILDDHHDFASIPGRRDAIMKTKECLVLLLA